uniref:Centrosomal protein 126 n=1 Tax=Pseudonaja textilis TaxID=8673 RepID=A0A670Y404_PSETE
MVIIEPILDQTPYPFNSVLFDAQRSFDFHQEVNKITRSGNVCSVDSLEDKEQNGSCTAPGNASSLSTQEESSFQHPEGSKSRSKHFSAEHDDTFSKNQHVNNWLRNLKTTNIQAASPFRDILIKYNVVPSDEVRCNPDLKSSVPTSSEQRESEACACDGNLTSVQNQTEDKNVLLICPSSNLISTGDPLPADSPAAKLNKVWLVPNPSPAASEQENFELSENNRTLSTETIDPSVDLSNQQWNVTSYFSNSFLLNCMQKGKDIHAARCTEDTDYVAEGKGEKHSDPINIEATTFEEPSKNSTDQHKDIEEGKEAEIILPVPQGEGATNSSDPEQQNSDNTCERKVPKSILKKESKYELSCFKAMVVNKGIKFGHQPVASVRDSVELAKIKGKDGEVQRNCKKLRWFDEINRVVEINNSEKNPEPCVNDISQAKPQAPSFQLKTTASKNNLRSIPSCLLNSVFPENNLETSQISAKLATVGNSERENAVHNVLVPKGYHIAKQAWIAPRSEEMIPFIYNCDPKNSKTNPRKGRMKMIKRPKSAKVPSSTIITKNRKSAIIRPQSASEATKIVRAPGKLIIPHAPCKPIQSKKTDEKPTDVLSQPSNLSKPSTDAENSQSDKNLLPECQTLARGYTDDPSTSDKFKIISSIFCEAFALLSAHFAFARRKQINENNENKRKALLEQRRQISASSARKSTDGTTQFLMPENLVNLSAAEGEILAGLDTSQPYRQIAVRNRPPRQGMSALSFEEHKVLQSLDRINHRLQSKYSENYPLNCTKERRTKMQ